LARRAGIQIQPEERQVSRRLRFYAAGRCAPPRHRTRKNSFRPTASGCFDFWRLEDQAPYRKAINEKLRDAAAEAAKSGIKLVLENEMTCNTATRNGGWRRCSRRFPIQIYCSTGIPETQPPLEKLRFPTAIACLPKGRIGHCHCKDVARKPDGSTEWAGHGSGIIDWVGQFRALREDGYRLAASLETHWHGAGTPEESSRQSWAWNAKGIARGGRFVNARLRQLKIRQVPG